MSGKSFDLTAAAHGHLDNMIDCSCGWKAKIPAQNYPARAQWEDHVIRSIAGVVDEQ